MLNKSKILRTAEQYVIAGKIARAVDEYRKLIEQDPEEPMLLNTVGDLLVRQGSTSEALEYYRRVADLYVSGGYHVKAGAMLKKILQLDAGDLASRERLAELYEKQGLRFEAANCLRRIIESKEQENNLPQALSFARRLTEVLPTDPEAWRDRAQLALRAEQAESAVEFFGNAVEAYRKQGNSGRAWETLVEAFQLDSGSQQLLDLLVETAASREHLLEAQSLLEREIESTGEDFPFRFYLGLVLEKLEQPEQAAEQYEILRQRGFHDRRVSEALVRVGQLEPLTQGKPEDGFPLEPLAPEELLAPDTPFAAAPEVNLFTLEASPEEAAPPPSDAPIESAPIEQPPGLEAADPSLEPLPPDPAAVEAGTEAAEGSGLFDLDALSQELDQGGAFQLDPPVDDVFTQPEEPAAELATGPDLDLPGDEIGSLDEALEEADFYLKLGFKDDAVNLLKRLLGQFPEDERVRKRARKARIPLPAAAPQPAAAAPEAEAAASPSPVDFENEIESALDGLFVGTQEEREEADPVLRYDIASNVSEKDGNFQVHYDLGLAYKEMGLLDDAVQEFRKAFGMIEGPEQNPQGILCCSMLASSFLQLGRLLEAIEWARKGLEMPGQKDFETRALQYDLALALERDGQKAEAVRVYREIAARDAEYRDVARRLEHLGG